MASQLHDGVDVHADVRGAAPVREHRADLVRVRLDDVGRVLALGRGGEVIQEALQELGRAQRACLQKRLLLVGALARLKQRLRDFAPSQRGDHRVDDVARRAVRVGVDLRRRPGDARGRRGRGQRGDGADEDIPGVVGAFDERGDARAVHFVKRRSARRVGRPPLAPKDFARNELHVRAADTRRVKVRQFADVALCRQDVAERGVQSVRDRRSVDGFAVEALEVVDSNPRGEARVVELRHDRRRLRLRPVAERRAALLVIANLPRVRLAVPAAIRLRVAANAFVARVLGAADVARRPPRLDALRRHLERREAARAVACRERMDRLAGRVEVEASLEFLRDPRFCVGVDVPLRLTSRLLAHRDQD
mmetsp:Transcript_36081/g.110630  ORF Transcript_36081/g.110630 Transcript_36081/m.110630 type:complete len:364 (+) Transcript_36081:214-1305(+)